ncbi:ABC transporter permease [Actinocatenispora rupis]|uniref:ABC transporter permease n=1 Tax=Actinocatenispora rupis TaxID=519421 RepID=A0A8J3NBK4_9ACTN|nr:ABC-2 family transporter protein [Actinocatenispora rupis]GID13444.1 ABC transporter permease [Actinocatenispora rupis]
MGTVSTVLSPPALRTGMALAGAGFRRWATYRQAMLAGAFTNTVFGFLRTSVMLAVAAGAGGVAAGYRGPQLATYVWVGQGLLAVVQLWGWTELSDRVRTGDVQSDLLRPVHPVLSYLAADLGRAAFALCSRFVLPMVVGLIAFDLYLPHRPATYPLFLLSMLFATVVSFGVRYLVNLTAFWLLDIRGVIMAWLLCSNALTGMYFPIAFLPGWAQAVLWYATPFPSILQAPVDVVVERGTAGHQATVLAVQGCWAAVMLAAAVVVQRRAERRLVVQGG